MTTTEMETIRKELSGINEFVRERFDPVSEDVGLLKEEAERLRGEITRLQERERQPKRRALAGQAGAGARGGRRARMRVWTRWTWVC